MAFIDMFFVLMRTSVLLSSRKENWTVQVVLLSIRNLVGVSRRLGLVKFYVLLCLLLTIKMAANCIKLSGAEK